MMNPIPSYGFSADYENFGRPQHEQFDEYLRDEFAHRHPDWDPSFGTTAFFKPEVQEYDYQYLVRGNVPGATSKAEAEKKVRDFLSDLDSRLKAHKPKLHGSLPKPKIRIWQW